MITDKIIYYIPRIGIPLLCLLFVGILIYGRKTSDKSEVVLEVIERLDTSIVKNITIEPQNINWKINLTLDTIVINDPKVINQILQGIKNKTKKSAPKASRTWECRLIVKFKPSYVPPLKNNKDFFSLNLEYIEKELFYLLPNTGGHQQYKCEGLSAYLESLTNYKESLGKNH